ncbi:neuralized-like protein 4 [Oscarella lobularis]|uniref:neuralized-like protein 4 n=1 Tax=Oscarella lobularis TaxID=121494 RepID=UPI0033134B49
MAAFHRRCGQNIRLTKENTVARRVDSYNRGVVYSAEPLELGEVFSVRIDEKEGGWAGGFRMGVCTCDPEVTAVPSGVLDVYNQEDHWVLSGSTLHHNREESNYSNVHLEALSPGDVVGVTVTGDGELHFIVNGDDKGAAAYGLPVDASMWMIGDIYGQSKQITAEVDSSSRDLVMAEDLAEEVEEAEAEAEAGSSQSMLHVQVPHNVFGSSGVFQIPVHMAGPVVVGGGGGAVSGGVSSLAKSARPPPPPSAKSKTSKTRKKPKAKDGDPYLFEGVTG